jgi:hypothetical protein
MKTTLLFLSIFLFTNLFGQNVYIPDANFKADLIGNPEINTNGDTEIQVSEASAFDGIIDCQDISISDLTGIEAFIAITELNCRENNISSLNVSTNIALTVLICDENNMTSLNLSNNIALTMLNCDENNLTSLDVSNCTDLMVLNCFDNQITSLNLSNNANLTSLHCYNNQLQCLNVKNGNNTAFIGFFANGNFNLSCIEVDDVNYSTVNWTSIAAQTSFSENCNNDCSSSTAAISEITTSKNLIHIHDMMGREATFKPNTPLIYVYDDGSIEKVFRVEY